MSEKIVQLNEEVIKGQLKELVRGSVEETLNELLEAEAEKLTQAARYERNEQRQGYRSGHYNRNLTTTSGDVTLKVPKLKGISFETAIIDADLLMQTIAEVLKKIEDYSISNWAEFEALVKKNLAMQQTDKTKKQQKRIPQITTRLEQIDKVLNKLYEDNALGTIPQDRYEQMSQKYSEEYYALKAELAELQEQLSAFENAGGRAQKFLKLTERYAAFTDLTPAILNEFISRIEVHERDKKRAKQAIQHIGIYFNYIGKFENEVTQLTEPTEQEIRQMREKIEEAQKEKSRAYHRQYSREYRARNLEKRREYDRMKAREYRAKKKAQEAAAAPAQ